MPSTLGYALFQRAHISIKPLVQFALMLGGSLLIAALAQVQIPLGFTPVPVTGQTLGVLLIAATLGSRGAVGAVALYLLEGSAGMPFFSSGGAGLAHLLGPTGGYLVGFIVSAYLGGMFCEKGWDRGFKSAFPAFLISQSIIFLFGVAWLSRFIGFEKALWSGVIPFIPGEVIKTAIAATLLPQAWKWVRSLDA